MSKKCTPLWREAHFKVKMYKTHQLRTTFCSCDVEKVHAVVARSTFPSQNVQNTPCSDHFWKLTLENVRAVVARSTFPSQNVQNTPCSDHFWKLSCRKSQRRWKSKVLKTDGLGPLLEVEFRKSARRCGAKHIFKSKCTKHTMLGPLLEVEFRKSARCCGAKHISKWKCTKHTMLGPLLEVEFAKKCTPLWREAHFQVKMYKAHHARTTFGCCTFPSENAQSTPCSDHFWMLRCLHYTTLHYFTVLS